MSVQEELYQFIKINFAESSVTANMIAEKTGQSRNTVSHHLNRLVDAGLLKKIKSKPTKFFLSTMVIEEKDPFHQLIGFDGSMRMMVGQFKSSVLYPNGLPLLLNGSSGTGKSFIAELIYEFAKQKEQIDSNAPYIVLNCADYANNPELLSSLLFGYTEGAFTGAIKEKKGLLDEADGGYLFLDEVHNLTPENQEKLFLLIDSGKFRRLGENDKWQKVNVRLIMATTEKTESTLLTTFRRRIPYKIVLPSFFSRPMIEKIELIHLFFHEEAVSIGKELKVSQLLIDELVNRELEGNIGQLRNEVKVLVADELSNSYEGAIVIPRGMDMTSEAQYFVFKPEYKIKKETTLKNEMTYKIINDFKKIKTFYELNDNIRELSFHIDNFLKEIEPTIEKNISSLFFRYGYSNIDSQIDNILKKYGFKTQKKQRQILINYLYLFSEYHNLLEERVLIKSDEKLNYRKYLEISRDLLFLFKDHHLYNYFCLILTAYLSSEFKIKSQINALIVMHGVGNASSIAAIANEMNADYVFDYFEMPVLTDTAEIVKEIVAYTRKVETDQGLVILVDMGSLEKIYSNIKGNVLGDLIVMNNVSTALALEVGSQLSKNILIRQLEQIDLSFFNVKKQYFEGVSQKPNVLVACLSGEGIAVKIKDILEKYLSNEVEVLTFDYQYLKDKCDDMEDVFFKNTLAIITTPEIISDRLPMISIEDILADNQSLYLLSNYMSEKELKECSQDMLKLFTIEGAASRLSFLNPERVINEISEVIASYEEYFKLEFPNFVKINLFLHMSMMIERLLKFGDTESKDITLEDTSEFKVFCDFSDITFEDIGKKYNVTIPKSEYALVYQLLKQIK